MALERHLAEADYCYLTTTGRVTGRPHEIEIWFGADGDRIYLLSGGAERSDWVRNIRRDPGVRIAIGESVFTGRAVPVGNPEEAKARRLLAAKYQGWRDGMPMSNWARTALVVAIDLSPASTP
jgi:deazaflavin-dependent oxidoreductase (nitroreductase family)